MLDCYQQLNQYSEAHNTIENQFQKFPNQYYLYVEQGYLYQLQHQQEKANIVTMEDVRMANQTHEQHQSAGMER